MKRKYNVNYKINLSIFEKLIFNRYLTLIQVYENMDLNYKEDFKECILKFIDEESDILLEIPEFKQNIENFMVKI